MRSREWLGVDFDGTLVRAIDFKGVADAQYGEPLWPMVYRVQQWLAEGRQVRIFTARVWEGDNGEWAAGAEKQRTAISDFCWLHFGQDLPKTATKDFYMVEFWDDRAVQVDPSTGEPTTYWESKHG